MEKLDRGVLSDTGVTRVDKLIIILGTVRPQYQEAVVATKPTSEDLEAAKRALERGEVSYGPVELEALARLRRYIIKKATKIGVALTVEKIFDIEQRAGATRGLKVHY